LVSSAGFRTHPGIEQAIDDQQAGLLPGDFLAQQPHHGIQPILLKGVEGADELDLSPTSAGSKNVRVDRYWNKRSWTH
jgi:hypothetical protein